MFQLEPHTHNQGHCSAPGLLLHLLNLNFSRIIDNNNNNNNNIIPKKLTLVLQRPSDSKSRAPRPEPFIHLDGWVIVMITQLAMEMVTMKMTMMMMMMMTTTMMMLTLAAAPHRMQTSWCNLHPLCFHQPSALSSPDHHDKR